MSGRNTTKWDDAVKALMGLGYSQADIVSLMLQNAGKPGQSVLYTTLESKGLKYDSTRKMWREHMWKQRKPAVAVEYDRAVITLNCPTADIDRYVDAWSTLADLEGYGVTTCESTQVDGKPGESRVILRVKRVRHV